MIEPSPNCAPGPRPRPLIGHLPELRRDRLAFLTGLAQRHGGVARFEAAHHVVHLVTEPAAIKHVLQDNHRNYTKQTPGFDAIRPLLGQGLLTSEGEFWLRQRRIAQPAFHRERIAAFSAGMASIAAEHADSWKEKAARGAPVDVLAEMMAVTLRIVARALLSKEVAHEADRVGRALTDALAWANSEITQVVRLPRALPTPRNRLIRGAVATLDEVVLGIIAERRQGGADTGDLLSLLMHARDEETGEGMSDVQLRDEVMTLFLAGHETTANLLAWAWMLLSRNPGVGRALRAELSSVLGGRAPGLADLPNLPYTRRVLDEVLRLYPPAWSVGRSAVADDVLCGFHIPAGSIVILNPYLTHRNPRYWENPEGFDPERFLPERVASLPRFAYFPFGGGPRQCIGNNFALMEAQIVLATLAQRFRCDLLPGQQVELDPSITLRPRGGLPMQIVAL